MVRNAAVLTTKAVARAYTESSLEQPLGLRDLILQVHGMQASLLRTDASWAVCTGGLGLICLRAPTLGSGKAAVPHLEDTEED